MTIPTQNQIAEDLQSASAYNAETYDDLYRYASRRVSPTTEACGTCGRPLVISAYASRLNSSGEPIYYTCVCKAAR